MNIKIEDKDFDLSDLAIKADLADYSPVRGCMVIKHYGYAIWELIQSFLDKEIKRAGHKNAYFPLFIPESFLKKEAEHVEGFSPECAVVTHAGGEKLEEPLVVRPTSETIIYYMFSKWIKSWRDLPYSINQWANVVRWEKRTRLFLRTTEFLWQEGHTAHVDEEDAQAMAKKMLEIYNKFMKEVLALAPIVGEKSASERFAGAADTYSLEVLLRDGKILQAGTSHYLGTAFSKAFEIYYQNKNNELALAHLTSWGVSTRLIGALIMGHKDERGLILPPKIAPIQVIIIPIYKNPEDQELIISECKQIKQELEELEIRTEIDADDQKTAGYKFNEWELKGVPIRIQIGKRDIENNVVEIVRRDKKEKLRDISRQGLTERIQALLNEIQEFLFQRNLSWREENIYTADSLEEINKILNDKGGFIKINWSGDYEDEIKLKEICKATVRVKALEEPNNKCAISGKDAKYKVYIGRAY